MTAPQLIAIAATALALIATGWMWWQFKSAPEGWQDEDGFHYGEPGDQD